MTTLEEVKVAEKEVSDNYKYFKKMLPDWKNGHLSEFALLHHQKLIGFFESEHDAIQTGIKDYGLGSFSVQSVQYNSVDFGHQSNALF